MTPWLDQCHFGDCREVMKSWPSAAADACVTDPPYGDTSLKWDKQCKGWMAEVSRVLKPAASVWVFGSMRYLSTIFSEMEAAGFKYAQDIVWEKQNGSGFHNDRFRRVHEHAIQFYRGAWADVFKAPQFTHDALAKTVRRKTKPLHMRGIGCADANVYESVDGGPRLQRSVIHVANEHGKAVHPTQKPLGIIAPLLAYSVPQGGIAIDPFAGSNTMGIAAAQLGIRWASCESDPASMQMQGERLRQRSLCLEAA
ncbi:MAG: methylase [Polaromonas sp.]|nr:methylase [Polaromonas sp.]